MSSFWQPNQPKNEGIFQGTDMPENQPLFSPTKPGHQSFRQTHQLRLVVYPCLSPQFTRILLGFLNHQQYGLNIECNTHTWVFWQDSPKWRLFIEPHWPKPLVTKWPSGNMGFLWFTTLSETNSKSTWKWMVGRWNFLLGWLSGRCYVSFREGTSFVCSSCCYIVYQHMILLMIHKSGDHQLRW